MPTFYAFRHAYNIYVRNKNGRRIGTVLTFPSRKDRDAWADAMYQYRESITAREAMQLLRSGVFAEKSDGLGADTDAMKRAGSRWV